METLRISAAGNRKNRRIYTRRPWMSLEDQILANLVKRYGPQNWDRIANHIPEMTGRSCRARWMNQLNPQVKRSLFSDEEKQKLLQLHEKWGNKWPTIATSFTGRTDNQLKNQYHSLIRNNYTGASNSSLITNPSGILNRGIIDSSSFGGGPSSVYARNENWVTVCFSNSFGSEHLGRIDGHQRTSNGDSMVSDANFVAISDCCVVGPPHQGSGLRNGQFIDFLGVGTFELESGKTDFYLSELC